MMNFIRNIGFGLATVAMGFTGCGKHEHSTNADPSHASHGNEAHDAPAQKTTDTHAAHQSNHAATMLMVKTDPAEIKPGQTVTLSLMIHDSTGAMVKEFDVVHEKKLHLIFVRDGLDYFAHIHPEIDSSGNIKATFAFPTAGTYRLYADHKPLGKDSATAIAEVAVVGTPPQAPELVPNAPGRVIAGELAANIAIEKSKMEGATRVSFALSDPAGKPIADLQPYLGAMGHLVILSADGKQYVHSHPLDGKSPDGVVAFDAHFPHPGIYKGWGQFQRSDTVREVPFVVKTE